ncbi:hypothetical protein LshimejAT787_1702740 [Lyophyllum shimeji]|uniref:Uncharacterized protein n=1 Tax=Lyophyllum shimeji TaxID=47721 RepID=A0A9P3PX59_LYOSH|nr:hypothetical protein LshimejAT787_1702740 [Lyophyllum shimeji]
MISQARQLWKEALWWTRIKLIYERITLTRYTNLYFFFALFNCVALVILQGVAFADNSAAVRGIGDLLSEVNVTKGLPILSHGVLRLCDNLPGQPGTTCAIVQTSNAVGSDSSLTARAGGEELWNRIVKKSPDEEDGDEDEDDAAGQKNSKGNGDLVNIARPATTSEADTVNVENIASVAIQDVSCAQTMLWLEDVLKNEKREDVVTLLYNFWLFSLALVTILNESLPHLGASLAGHVLATGWAAFRVSSSEKMRRNYENLVVNGACHINFMGEWWEHRRGHTISILVVSSVALFMMAYLSFMLFKVYAFQSFGRVGASDRVNRIYKIVLVFSAFLQLTAFFALASPAMWLDRICSGLIHDVVHHNMLYVAAFIVSLLLLLPWLVLGWVCVRKEGRKRFLIFSAISVVLVGLSSMMFASALYRFIFNSWPFFTTITVTAYVLTVATALLGVWCRLNFGKGLKHFLQVSDALDGVDFTPVYFSKDAEKGNTFNVTLNDSPRYLDEKYSTDSMTSPVQQPELTYNTVPRAPRGQSVYSTASGMPVKLSSTPSLFQERDRAASRAASARRTKAFGGNHLNLGRDGYTQPQMPPRSATPSIRTKASRRSRNLTAPSPRSSLGSTSAPPDPSPTQTRAGTPPAMPTRPGLPANPRIRPAYI